MAMHIDTFQEGEWERGPWLEILEPNDGLLVAGTTSPVMISTGLACLHNMIYWNSEPLNIDILTPVTQPRIDRIVLRINWEKQTVRIAHILGDEGAGAPPMEVNDKILDEALACCSIGLDGAIVIENKPSAEIRILPRRYWLSLKADDIPLDSPAQNMV